ncbi:MAG: bifunctional methylenetetrahydrofolate dehydrogenase/methenyltetrahydrofolate cyclohydrolase FolD [Methylobacterium sp.]|nr:bifunctional methylenetetrahydrofolate dehydrogenase/methenyltetrahydrofolate cyclohydrolase FolD [Methylobacterium sp.]MCE2933518.1 bifunctional methylenetetrahydrofolate dehydrogenase/methenyltetrahydrofolate cyclohydrolase FolD [Hyphomicrobiales bacterium]MCA3655011.1 bifunctional methylenetetrahydrofolate dehydrogenase/methenyltetrahydrofolate cyclohydrolase FolD [Methylobacterium sp.]MCA3658363.1 bifunctional methylenetetrahydrofolate dehydrogenase/methenyltetrahydrofolate cyclohydrolase
MPATLIDGKAVAASLRAKLAMRVAAHVAAGKRAPGLAVMLVGEDPASQVYVASKAKQTTEIGMVSIEHKLPVETSQADLLARIAKLNADPSVDGILVQLPLPPHIDADAIIEAIDPAKDVDGFHPVNVGRLATGGKAFVPCTPRGSMRLIRTVRADLSGLHAVVVGRSNIVGKPMAQLLLAANCTVTIAHSRTTDLPGICRQADILVAAVGRPLMLNAAHVKPGAIVIDVGINRVPAGEKTKLVGDVDFEAVRGIAGAITPVPGGVGPMTIACLLENTLDSYELKLG